MDSENQESKKFFGTEVIVDGPVKFIGDPKDDPENNELFIALSKSCCRIFKELSKDNE